MKEKLIERAFEIFDKDLSVKDIHKHLYQGILPNAGELRDENIYEDGYAFEMASFIKGSLSLVEIMPESTFEDIINKYIEMTFIHPFAEGNNFALRTWLGITIKKNLQMTLDYSLINKDEYISSLKRSAINPDVLSVLLQNALTKEVEDKQTIKRSIEASVSLE